MAPALRLLLVVALSLATAPAMGATAHPSLDRRSLVDRRSAPQPDPTTSADPVWKFSYEVGLDLVGDGRSTATWLLNLPEQTGNVSTTAGPSTTADTAAVTTGAAKKSHSHSHSHRSHSRASSSSTSDGASLEASRFEAGAVSSYSDGAVRKQAAAPKSVTVTIKAYDPAGRYRIQPGVYGINMYGAPPMAAVTAAGIKLMRRGGNKESRYNWQVDATNTAADWFFQSIPNSGPKQPNSFVAFAKANQANGIATLAQVPMLGWLPSNGETRGCSYSIKKYGPQQSRAPDNPDCGNGVTTAGKRIVNDPRDAAVFEDTTHQSAFVQMLTQQLGWANKGGVKYYALDNEPVWWSYVHRDIETNASSYDEIVSRGIVYARVVKRADTTALITGPVCGGWSDTFYSNKDMQSGWGTKPWKYWSNPVDRNAHGGKPFLQYYLEQMQGFNQRHRLRLVDIVDIHAYVTQITDATDAASQAQRIADVRTLWDPAYYCLPSCDWIDPVTAPEGVPKYLVRVKNIIQAVSPGLGLAVSEYNFGGTKDISGAIAQAEALGVFGFLNVTIASVFPGPSATSTVYQAFKMYGNYDGKGASFGSQGVGAVSSDRLSLSSWAAINTNRRVMTVLLINLTPSPISGTVNLADVRPTKAIRVFRYSASNLQAIVALPSINPSRTIAYSFPGYSLTMMEVPM